MEWLSRLKRCIIIKYVLIDQDDSNTCAALRCHWINLKYLIRALESLKC